MLTKKEGEKLISIAKVSIRDFYANKDVNNPDDAKLDEKSGVFVTIYHRHGKERVLRGCIGFIESRMPLWKSVAEAARLSAFEDPRFSPLRKDEFDELSIEISVLTKPEELKAKDAKETVKSVKVGKDGLIIEMEGYSGLLLPQVATEYKWDAEEFLEQTCLKAGLETDAWKKKGCVIKKFQAQIFSE